MTSYEQYLKDIYDRATPTTLDTSLDSVRRMMDLLDRADLNNVKNMLDIGCGTSWAGILAAGRNLDLRVIGVDISPNCIAVSKRNIRDNNLALRVIAIEEDVMKIDFDNRESFDLVFASSSIILFPNVHKVLQLAHRVLREKGQLAFSSYTKNSFFNHYITESVRLVLGIELPDVKDNLNTVSDCICDCKEVGFSIVESEQISYNRLVKVEDISWDGTWIHPKNPIADISTKQKLVLSETFKELILADAENGYLLEEREHLYTIAHK
jgi:ubiquinone/menaquinone biosynthesis C-methylase UbiE